MSALAESLLLAVLAAGQPEAVPAAGAYDHLGTAFVHNLRAAAVQAEAEIPNRVVVGTGYSAVDLAKRSGAESGECDTTGAGVHLDLRQGLLENSWAARRGQRGPHVQPDRDMGPLATDAAGRGLGPPPGPPPARRRDQ